MNIDTVSLQARITQVNQPTPAQMLIADLWAALNQTLADLAAAQQAGNPQTIIDLQAQVADLTQQLAAAQSIATADENQIAQLMANDGATIADLTKKNADLTTAKQVSDASLATAQQQLAATQAQLLTATNALSSAQANFASAQKQITALNATINGLNATITTLQQQLAGQVPTPPVANTAPVWTTVPTILFNRGHAAEISVAQYVTDKENDPITLALITSGLSNGVTFDAPNKKFIYDGLGDLGQTAGNILNANDGKP